MARTKYYHVDEAAEKLGISIEEVRAMLASKEIKGHKLGRRWLVDMEQPCFLKLQDDTPENIPIRYVKDEEHEAVISKYLNSVKHSLYIATANFKNVHIRENTLISILNSMNKKGIDIKVICSRLQSPESAEFSIIVCPRNHMKMFIFDKNVLYIGSANLTPAALEDRKSKKKKTNNHEAGILTTDKAIIEQALAHFTTATKNKDCETCKIKECKFRNKQ